MPFRHQPFWCEENIWHLAGDPAIGPGERHVLGVGGGHARRAARAQGGAPGARAGDTQGPLQGQAGALVGDAGGQDGGGYGGDGGVGGLKRGGKGVSVREGERAMAE